MEVDAIQNAQRDDLLDVSWRSRQGFVIGEGAWRREIKLVRERARNPTAHAGCIPERYSHTQTRDLEKVLETGLNVQRSRLGQDRRSVQHPGIVIHTNWANFSVHHPEDSGLLPEPQFELRTRSLWRIEHDSVFFKH